MVAGGTADAKTDVVLRPDVSFQPLNPARGNASPQAGVLWGDLRDDVPTGAIIEFGAGFSSPPHIHNITYRAVVIEGAVHNDDPDAANMWMGPGSFWTQPAGKDHVTSAAAETGASIFLEILQGPYLVQPSEEAFESDEHSINLESGNIVWLEASDVTWIQQDEGPQMAFLWGGTAANEMNGTFLKLPAGFRGELRGNGAQIHAVTIRGEVTLDIPGQDRSADLVPGSYFGAADDRGRRITCKAERDCVFYIRTEGKYDLIRS
ncbi:DUF4437 domain-containing protein [Emcibacter sp. SYSU 3D8]|uniref:DUF4437 domain-containing protein n=1 Tax=Emcibacter sp. SYSU 3D8 TaxID=3133969 RepID=UPI0031FE4EE1